MKDQEELIWTDLLEELDSWRSCTRCPLYKTNYKYVLYDGSIPSPLLFIGEAPGEIEDMKGRPFVGPAGRVLRAMLRDLNIKDFCLTNILACVPWEDPEDIHNHTTRPPTKEEADSCRERINLMLKLVEPKKVILLGNIAKKYYRPLKDHKHIKVTKLDHPSFIARRDGIHGLEYKRNLLYLKEFISE